MVCYAHLFSLVTGDLQMLKIEEGLASVCSHILEITQGNMWNLGIEAMLLKLLLIIPRLSQETQVSLALKILEVSENFESMIDRMFTLLVCFGLLTNLSVLRGTKSSVIFKLYNKDWFVKVWNSEPR